MGNTLPSLYETFRYKDVLAFFKTNVLASKWFDKERPFVSVGCGIARYERRLSEDLGLHFILVDPAPTSYNTPIFGEPTKVDFDYVNTLLKKKPALVGHCNLVLIKALPNESMYDFDALCALQPKQVIVMYESYGGDGGKKFHHWLQTISAPNNCIEPLTNVNKLKIAKEVPLAYGLTKKEECRWADPDDNLLHFNSRNFVIALIEAIQK